MKLVVGLGNPGSKYADTRHNVGWMVLDQLADRAGWSGRAKSRDAAATARGRIGGLDVMLVKPLTFMNDSGVAVRKILARERVKLEDVLVVVDDFALPFGRLRMRPSGTAGGHNGLRSIIAELGTQDFARLRVGIGEPRRDAIDHVLSRFASEERRLLPALLDAAADAVESWGQLGAASAANRWNAWLLEGTGPAPASAGTVPSAGKGPSAGKVPSAGEGPAAGKDAGRSPSTGRAPAAGRDASSAPGEPAAGDGAPSGTGAGPATGASAPAEPGGTAGPGEVDGPAGPDGIRRTRTGWRRILGDLGAGDR